MVHLLCIPSLCLKLMTQALPLLTAVLLPLLSSPAIAQSDWLQDTLKRTEERQSQMKEKITNRTSFNKRATKKLNQAIKKGNVEAVKSTILAGANVNDKGKSGWTPLHLAAKRGHTEIIKILIDAGADLSTSNQLKQQGLFGRDSEGDSSVDLAYRYGHNEARRLLINETANFLINTEAYVDSKYANGWTLLYWAAIDGYVDVARNLIDAGADVNNKYEYIETVSESIAESEDYDHNKSPEDNQNRFSFSKTKTATFIVIETPLSVAYNHDRKEMVQFLIDSGADRTSIDQAIAAKATRANLKRKLKEELQRELETARAEHARKQQRELERERLELERERLELERERLESLKDQRERLEDNRLEDRGDTQWYRNGYSSLENCINDQIRKSVNVVESLYYTTETQKFQFFESLLTPSVVTFCDSSVYDFDYSVIPGWRYPGSWYRLVEDVKNWNEADVR